MKTRGRMPRCEAVVCDIKRHLRAHVKRDELHTNDTDGHAEIMRLGKRKFMTSANNPEIRGRKPRTRRKKGALWLAVRSSAQGYKHLLSTHQMKIGSVPYKMCMREAKPYMSMMELDEHPCRVQAKAQPFTSSAAPRPAEEPEAAACEDDASSSHETNITIPTPPLPLKNHSSLENKSANESRLDDLS